MNRHKSQSRSQPHFSEHFQRQLLIYEQSFGDTEQDTHDAILASGAPDRAVVAVDLHRPGLSSRAR
jgi:hypothetical protein